MYRTMISFVTNFCIENNHKHYAKWKKKMKYMGFFHFWSSRYFCCWLKLWLFAGACYMTRAKILCLNRDWIFNSENEFREYVCCVRMCAEGRTTIGGRALKSTNGWNMPAANVISMCLGNKSHSLYVFIVYGSCCPIFFFFYHLFVFVHFLKL